MTPKFGVWSGKQDGNRLIYPLDSGAGDVVLSMHAVGVKEDIVLYSATSNIMTFDYSLNLGSNRPPE